MTTTEGDQAVSSAQTDAAVLVAIARVEGQLTSFVQMMTSQGEQLANATNDIHAVSGRVTTIEATRSAQADQVASQAVELNRLNNRITAIEAAKRAAVPWWTVVAALASAASIVTVLILFLDRLYGGK